mgnify:FL=1
MKKFILGTKEKMTQVFDQDGKVQPVTLVSATPSVVLQLKDKEKDGYTAVQIGFGEKRENKISKPQRGHFKGLGNFKFVKEFRVEDVSSFLPGNKIDIGIFSVGDKVEISGISKGKGFQGVVKRHGFKGGRRSHGQKHSEREAGSIGGGGRAGGRVTKGLRMAGRMGSDRVTIKNLELVSVDKENNILAVLGAIPGKRGTLLEIRQK